MLTDPPAGRIPVRVEGATKRLHQGESVVEAIKNVCLSIEEGEFVAVMGASGSGKSTLLHVMAGLAPPDEGRVVIDDTDLSTMSDGQLTRFRRRKIGLVFQAFNLIPRLGPTTTSACPSWPTGTTIGSTSGSNAYSIAWGWSRGGIIGPMHLAAASSSAWQSPAPWSTIRPWSWLMNRPAVSTRSADRQYAGCCENCAKNSIGRSWLSPTNRPWPHGRSVWW